MASKLVSLDDMLCDANLWVEDSDRLKGQFQIIIRNIIKWINAEELGGNKWGELRKDNIFIDINAEYKVTIERCTTKRSYSNEFDSLMTEILGEDTATHLELSDFLEKIRRTTKFPFKLLKDHPLLLSSHGRFHSYYENYPDVCYLRHHRNKPYIKKYFDKKFDFQRVISKGGMYRNVLTRSHYKEDLYGAFTYCRKICNIINGGLPQYGIVEGVAETEAMLSEFFPTLLIDIFSLLTESEAH